MNLPPMPKEAKITLLIIFLVVIISAIFLLWKPHKVVYKDTDYTKSILDLKTIDTLEYQLKKQTELNIQYVQRIDELEKGMDSIKNLIAENSKKITTIKKRRKDETKVNYNAWTDNEFTRFFANRYQQH
jgi:hypothetical protein